MKRFLTLMAVLLALPAAAYTFSYSDNDCDLFREEGVDIDYEDGSLIFTYDGDDCIETVVITEDYELIVNGRHVDLNRRQQKLVEDYYEDFMDIAEFAKEIGIEGAKIGAKGAKLGITAIAKIFKLLEEDYDTEDLEEDMDRESEKLERAARKLERKAEKLEDIIDDIEDQQRTLRRSIPELRRLGWF